MMAAWALKYTSPLVNYVRHGVFNLTNPEKSTLLMAPLARESGGYSACRELEPSGVVTERGRVVFEDQGDPDYQLILEMIEEMSELLYTERKRWHMDGFKPHPAYVREMKRYGILPADFDADSNEIDVYETERRYFESQWYTPK